MNWVNTRSSLTELDAFVHATTSQVGTWFLLLSYCCRQENSGTIVNCRDWAPATWVRIIGTETPADHCPLWRWHRNHLVVEFYPKDQEIAAQLRSANSREAARKRWRTHI